MKRTRVLGRLVVCSCVIALGQASMAATWYVDKDAPAGGNGTRWPEAFDTVQEALIAADVGDAIWVAQGTYEPGSTRAHTFAILRERELRGGYIGYDEPDPDERDVHAYVTVLSGDIGTVNDPSDNSYHVVTMPNSTDTLINGFTIAGGNADESEPPPSESSGIGAGVTMRGADHALVNCTIESNRAGKLPNATPPCGNPLRGWGGGVAVLGPLEGAATTKIVNCAFLGNAAFYQSAGGALYHSTLEELQVVNTLFANNVSDGGSGFCGSVGTGGAVSTGVGHAEFTNCTFADNEATGTSGSGESMSVGGGVSSSVTSCIFWNEAGLGSGEVQIWAGTPTSFRVDYSNVQGGWTGLGSNNLTPPVDPAFVNPGIDYKLTWDSPCIDEGDTLAVPLDDFDVDDDEVTSERTPDLRLSIRVSREVVDMGAYETCMADVTRDGIVDVLDLLEVLLRWGPCPSCPEDITGPAGVPDGLVDVLDLLIVLTEWGCGTQNPEAPPDGIADCIQKYTDPDELAACIQTMIETGSP